MRSLPPSCPYYASSGHEVHRTLARSPPSVYVDSMADRRTVCVTGAGSGIGRAFAEALARAGDEVLLLDVDAQGLAATADVLGGRSAGAGGGDRPGIEAAGGGGPR